MVQLAFQQFLGARHLGQFADEFGARFGQIPFLARRIEFFQQGRQGKQRGHAAIHQFPPFLQRLLATVHAPFGGGQHFVGLFVGEFVAVNRAAEQRGILGIGDGGLRLRQLRPRDYAGLHQGAQAFDSGLGAHDFRRVLGLCKHTA